MRLRIRMRAYAETAVRDASPIFQIVAALEAGPRPVGNLIMNVAGHGQPFSGIHVEGGENIVIWNRGG